MLEGSALLFQTRAQYVACVQELDRHRKQKHNGFETEELAEV